PPPYLGSYGVIGVICRSCQAQSGATNIHEMKNAGEITGWHYTTRQPVRLRWADGLISALEAVDDAPSDLWIAPSLVDLQINGYGGVDFQQDDLTVEDLLSATQGLRDAGCGSYLLTLITED